MVRDATALGAIFDEARSLLDRVSRLEPFALQVPMLVAAGPSFEAQVAIERHLDAGRALCLRLQHGSSVRGWGLTSWGRGMGSGGARAEGVDVA
jgi:hypothetical protein